MSFQSLKKVNQRNKTLKPLTIISKLYLQLQLSGHWHVNVIYILRIERYFILASSVSLFWAILQCNILTNI